MYLWILVLLLLVLWNVAMFSASTLGVWIHVLPVLATIVTLIAIVRRTKISKL